MQDNSAKQSWTLDPSAISALGIPSLCHPVPALQARPEHLRSARGTQHGARSSLQAHPPSSSLALKVKKSPTGGFVPGPHNSRKAKGQQSVPLPWNTWWARKKTVKGISPYQQKESDPTESGPVDCKGTSGGSEGWALIHTTGLCIMLINCHLELPVWKLTNGTFLGFFKAQSQAVQQTDLDPVYSDLLEQERGWPQDSPDDQILIYCSWTGSH